MSTCIRFVTRTDQTDYISIVKQSGCWSWVGRTGKSQELSLGTGCLQKGIIQHELIHALGFWHEQSRSDRDAFVRINFGNILEGQEGNFGRWDTNNLNVPYDYTSVMHYAPKDFSKNSGDTIVPLDASAQIGQRDGMSENDILKINKLYVCSKYTNKAVRSIGNVLTMLVKCNFSSLLDLFLFTALSVTHPVNLPFSYSGLPPCIQRVGQYVGEHVQSHLS